MNRIVTGTAFAAAALLALNACGSEAAGGKKATATAADPGALLDGQWESMSELVRIDGPELTEDVAKAMLGKVSTASHCLTPAQVARPSADFFANNAKSTDCTPTRQNLANGRVDVAMQCTDRATKQKMQLAIQGEYRPTAYLATMTMTTPTAAGADPLVITVQTNGRRIGDCGTKSAPALSDQPPAPEPGKPG